jgi:signal transduction histidine kinase
MNMQLKRVWSWADWFVVGLRIFGTGILLTNMTSEELAGRTGLVLSLALLSFAVPQLFYLPGRIRASWFIAAEALLSGGFSVYLTTIIPDARGYFFLPVFIISFLSTRKELYAVLPFCLGVMPLAMGWVAELSADSIINYLITMTVFFAFGVGFGVFLRQKDEIAQAYQLIEEKNRALEHSLEQVERLTLLEERSRMSRELHDTVGHSLTASIIAMEAVHTLIDRDANAAKERLRQLAEFNRTQLNSFRQTVHDMAMNELRMPVDELLRTAAETFSQQTGTGVSVQVEGAAAWHTPESVKLALLRCLQESMTNAKKHGQASELRIRLALAEKQITLTIQDNGAGTNGLTEGFGVEGMKSRMEALRGTFEILSRSGAGTTVTCHIPMGV